jgi:flavin-dependent dehydrogenase
MKLWDAIVVGAGPAGCTAATLLAREGLRVRLLDKSSAPPPKICGEYLSPGCLPILNRIGAVQLLGGAGARPLSGMVIHTAAGRSLRATFPSGKAVGSPRLQALAVRRDRLDPILLDLALRAGADYAPSFQVSDLVRENERVVGVHGRDQGRPAALRGRLIIGADGRNSVVARRLGAVNRHPWLDKVALVGYAAGVRRAEDVGEIFLGRNRYCILNPVAPDLTNIGLVVDRREFHRPANAPDFLREAGAILPRLADRLARARLVAPVRCLGPLAHHATRVAAPGALLVGDAAGFLDPFTGEGIHAALRSAELAVHYALPALGVDAEAHPDVQQYAAALLRERNAKWRLCVSLQHAIRRPLLAECLASLLSRRPDLTTLLMAAVGDLIPVREVNPLGFLARLLAWHASPRASPEGS